MKAFTLIEVLIVLVIIGILSTISIEIFFKVYENYYFSKEYNRLSFEIDLVLDKIASKLRFRVKNSLIADECNISDDSCKNGNIKSFDRVSNITGNLSKYKVIEWLGKDIYAKRGMWDNKLKCLIGYSGFVDLKKTTILENDKYSILTPFSNFNYVREIDSNYTKEWNINGDIFQNRLEVLIFSGPDNKGDFADINNSYGFWQTKSTRVFEILKESNFSNYEANLSIKAIDESNSTTVYQHYFLINTAYAIVPICANSKCDEYNLTLKFNYYPWKKEDYTKAHSVLLASNISKFNFKCEDGVVKITICMNSSKNKFKICREKIVF